MEDRRWHSSERQHRPRLGDHYFGNVISGDTGGYNAWAIEDNTGDGGQFHGYSRNMNVDENVKAFADGWVTSTRAKMVSGTQVR
jgi:hypothetical protein